MSPRFGDELARVLEGAGVSARETRDLRLEGNRLHALAGITEGIGDVNTGALHPDVFARGPQVFSQYPGQLCVVNNYPSQSVATATLTPAVFTVEGYDTDNFVDLTTHNDRVTIPPGAAGIYEIWGHGEFEAVAGGTHREVWVTYNGAQSWEGRTGATTSYVTIGVIPAKFYTLTAGDYLGLSFYHNATGNMLCHGELRVMRVR